jgi:hypothetical protein
MPDSKITALTSIGTSTDPANDPLVLVDVSDTSMAASGTTKKVTLNQLLATSPTATLASATITGAANFNGGALAGYLNGNLMFGSSGNIVNFFAQSSGFAFKENTGANNLLTISNAGVFGFLDGAGGTRMTLNSTGLGVGVSPAYKIHASQLVCASDPTQNGSAGRIYGAFLNAVGEPGLDLRRWDGGGGNNHGTTFIQTNLVGDTLFYNGLQASNTRATSLKMTLDASGRLILLASTTTPATLSTNGQLTMTATSDTNLRFSYRGSDGVTRVANITLA